MQGYDPYQSPQYSNFLPETPHGPPHSGLGIASLAIGVLGGVLMCAGTVAAAVAVGAQAEMAGEASTRVAAAGCTILVGCAVNLLGLALGGVGLVQRRNKLFPILGVALNGLSLLAIAALFVLGIATG